MAHTAMERDTDQDVYAQANKEEKLLFCAG